MKSYFLKEIQADLIISTLSQETAVSPKLSLKYTTTNPLTFHFISNSTILNLIQKLKKPFLFK